MSKKVRTLLRVSSKQQLHDNDIPVQRAEAEQYIEKQSDWLFDSEYIEKAVSAYKNGVEDREVLLRILEDAKEHQFDVLLTYMSDRIGRKEEYGAYVAALNKLGVEVWTIKDGQLKTEEHIDKLLNFIRFWQNEGESKKTGMRVRDSMQELVKAGRFMGGRAPYGYRFISSGQVSSRGRLLKKLEIVEEHAAVVRKIYHLAVYQGFGYEKVAKALNEEGIPAITAAQWKSGTIASILKNPIYMGYTAYNRRVNHGNFTRLDRKDWIYSQEQIPELVIVPQPEWEMAQEIREARKQQIEEAKRGNLLKAGVSQEAGSQASEPCGVPFCTRGKLALTGLVYCGYCGRRLKNGSYCNHWEVKATGEKKAAFFGRYICPGKCETRSCYSQNYLEWIVFEGVSVYFEQLKGDDILEEIQMMQEQQKKLIEKELRQTVKEQREAELDIKTLEEKIPQAIRGEYYFSAEKLSELIKEKKDRKENLGAKEKELRSVFEKADIRKKESFEKITDWRKEFAEADIASKHMILSSLIDKIIVKDSDIVIKFKIRLPETSDFAVPK